MTYPTGQDYTPLAFVAVTTAMVTAFAHCR